MRLVANSILVTLIVSVFIVTFSNFLLFFPWYLTLMYETYNLSIQAASENYISSTMIKDAKNDLSDRPLYRQMSNDIKIYMDDIYVHENYTLPYKQRGEKFTVSLECKFPFNIKVNSTNFSRDITIRFDIPTTGLKYYKELT